jgi:hypothetical protein
MRSGTDGKYKNAHMSPDVKKYLEDNPQIKNRLFLKRIQLGVALR